MIRSLIIVALSLFVSRCVCIKNPIYVISNAEAPSLKQPGLTPVGRQRAEQCIPPIFKSLNVGKIISCLPDRDSGLCSQTVDTATPLAKSLGLEIDTSCGAGEESDDDCISGVMKSFSKTSEQAIVIVWDVGAMDDLFENIDADYPEKDDDDDDKDDDEDEDDEDEDDEDEDDEDEDEMAGHNDLITTVQNSIITSVVSQNCTGIDGPAAGTHRRRSAYSPRRRPTINSKRLESHQKMVKRRKAVF